MTRPLNTISDTPYSIYIDQRSGGNTPKPHSTYGGFYRRKANLTKEIPRISVVSNNTYTPAAKTVPRNGLHENPSWNVSRLMEYPSFSPGLGFGVDLALRSQIAETDFSFLITAMEMRSTIVGLGSLAHRLGNAYGALRQGNLKGFTKALDVSSRGTSRIPARKVRENAASYLLEYQFGIVSLYNDMYGLATSLYDQSQFPRSVAVKAMDKREVSQSLPTYIAASYTREDGQRAQAFAGYGTCSATGTELYKAKAEVVVKSPLLYYASQFGMTNPVHALYSVAPNSWLFDAFVPLGDFLNQLYLPPGISLENQGFVKILDAKITSPKRLPFKTVATSASVEKKPNGSTWQVTRTATGSFRGPEGSFFLMSMGSADYSKVSYQVKPKLPFVGQAITSCAYAHQRSEDLKNLLRRNR